MINQIEYLKLFWDEFEMPKQALATFIDALEKIYSKSECDIKFEENLKHFYEPGFESDEAVLDVLNEISSEIDVHKYTIHLLYYICLSEVLREKYENLGIDYQIYYDSMCDLKWKIIECHNVYGIWGSFVAGWFKRFFDPSRFALGRLQFELIDMEKDYTDGEVYVKAGEKVINVHIPSCGPLTKEKCDASYDMAEKFFAKEFVDRPVVFVCNSWLLYEKILPNLKPLKNIYRFCMDYDIVGMWEDEKNGDAWRIYNRNYDKFGPKLERDTKMREIYANWLEQGNTLGGGNGVYVRKKLD